MFKSINPTTGLLNAEIACWDNKQIDSALRLAASAASSWGSTAIEMRSEHLRNVATALRRNQERLAGLITQEMGKLIKESRAEIDKCAWACEFYAEQGPRYLSEECIVTEARCSYVMPQPLGTVLAVMPWNFPFWQVFRAAAPVLMGGNTLLLKHAANVPLCAAAIEEIFAKAGVSIGVFINLAISAEQVAALIADPRVHAVTVTGSEEAGHKIAAQAGAQLKKSVLELGGSDPFIILDDVNVPAVVEQAIAARFVNAGQSCIAAKRFIVVDAVADEFVALFAKAVRRLRQGDPLDEATTLAPLARRDLRDSLQRQVTDSIAQGATPIAGCQVPDDESAFYPASILDHVARGMPAYEEELFGPVAAIIRVADDDAAIGVANESRFGLGASVWTKDLRRGEAIAHRLQAGMCFVNGLVKSDPRLPFGGIKASGYGRELSYCGMREFLNIKTIWLG